VWRLLSEDSRAAVVTTEKWAKGKATLKELEAVGVMAAASTAAASTAAASTAAALAVSRAVAGWSAELWAARAVSRAVESALSGEVAADWLCPVTAAVMSVVAARAAESEEARQEIAEIVREVIPNCPFPRL